MREFRAALGDHAETPLYLETVTGLGYRFLEGRYGRVSFPEATGPIVGRESELNQLMDYLRRASDGERQLVMISGEPGIGKTTLLKHFLDPIAKQNSARIVRGQCLVHYGKGRPLVRFSRRLRDPVRGLMGQRWWPRCSVTRRWACCSFPDWWMLMNRRSSRVGSAAAPLSG